MGQKDIVEKKLEDYNDVFADIANVLLFNGKKLVLEDELENAILKSQYKADNSIIHELERDTAKYWKRENIKIALLGMENQTATDRDMPFRIIGYDGVSYRAQLLDKEAKERFPVITLVLYFGEKHWTGPKKLSELLQVPKELVKYFNDYEINIFEISWLTDEQVNMFQSDFKIVADYFVQKRKNNDYKPTSQVIDHVDEVLKLMSVFTNDIRFEQIFDGKEKEGGKFTMCDVLDRIEEKGIEKGKLINLTNNIKSLMNSMQLSFEQACKALQLSEEDVNLIKPKM